METPQFSEEKVERICKAAKDHLSLSLDQEKAKKLHWMCHPYVAKHYINIHISGDAETDWLEWLKKEFVKTTLPKGLSLGCGSGFVERRALELNLVSYFDAVDISEEAIKVAKELATRSKLNNRINYLIKNINNIFLPENHYDLILVSHALHHIENLEHVLNEINKSLKPDGILVLNEYVGPSQFQFTEKQLRIMNELLEILPSRYRLDLSSCDNKKIKEKIERPPIEFMNQVDPSEAIRSAEITPLIKKNFEVITQRDYGGTLLQFLLANIVGNFDEKKEEDRAFLDFLFKIEEILIRENIIKSDFTVIVAKKKLPF